MASVVSSLVSQGIPRDTIDGGWIWNGDQLYGVFEKRKGYYRGWYRSRDYVVTDPPEHPPFRDSRGYKVPVGKYGKERPNHKRVPAEAKE
jgi:hypothetical protein